MVVVDTADDAAAEAMIEETVVRRSLGKVAASDVTKSDTLGAIALKTGTLDVVHREAADETETWIITETEEMRTREADPLETTDTSAVAVAETTLMRCRHKEKVLHHIRLAPTADFIESLAGVEAEAKTECEDEYHTSRLAGSLSARPELFGPATSNNR